MSAAGEAVSKRQLSFYKVSQGVTTTSICHVKKVFLIKGVDSLTEITSGAQMAHCVRQGVKMGNCSSSFTHNCACL